MPPKGRTEPLSIWFFVGLILSAYGVLITISGSLPASASRPTILAELRPALWWGAITALSGAVFLAIGMRGRREGSRPSSPGAQNRSGTDT